MPSKPELRLAFSRDVISPECHSWIPAGFEVRLGASQIVVRPLTLLESCGRWRPQIMTVDSRASFRAW